MGSCFCKGEDENESYTVRIFLVSVQDGDKCNTVCFGEKAHKNGRKFKGAGAEIKELPFSLLKALTFA